MKGLKAVLIAALLIGWFCPPVGFAEEPNYEDNEKLQEEVGTTRENAETSGKIEETINGDPEPGENAGTSEDNTEPGAALDEEKEIAILEEMAICIQEDGKWRPFDSNKVDLDTNGGWKPFNSSEAILIKSNGDWETLGLNKVVLIKADGEWEPIDSKRVVCVQANGEWESLDSNESYMNLGLILLAAVAALSLFVNAFIIIVLKRTRS